MKMLLGNTSTVQFLHCKALLLSIEWKQKQRIKILEVYTQTWVFNVTSVLNEGYLANHTTVRKTGSQPLI